MKKFLSLIAMLSIISLLLTACGGAPTAAPVVEAAPSNAEVIAEGRLEPIQGTNLTFQVRGVVEEVLVKPGDTVKKGDVLARLTNAGSAEAQLLIAQNNY